MVLAVRNLRVEIQTQIATVPVIDDLSFTLHDGEVVGVVGESGCGKSMTALAILGLLPQDICNVTAGEILFQGKDLLGLSDTAMQTIRGNDISMIFQEPMTSLNPVFTVGEQIAEVLRLHQGLGARAAQAQAVELLAAVRIPDPKARATAYPFQLSGGQRQRVMIAMALACQPKILIADEPTTALDVTVQAQILELLQDLRKTMDTAILLITHDMGVIAEMTSRVLVMYAGRKLEEATTQAIITKPIHPYTQGLIACVPHLSETVQDGDLTEIAGVVPAITEFGKQNCLFAPRCAHVMAQCHTARPPQTDCNGHVVECWMTQHA
ncbi:MAG: ABC transporter ATP-binding protein [Pseudomonadota bacterium]